ncbi:ABC transporter substrate-binding protein [Azospirillum sp. SYSU D00513]|uniref:ABC transporter substrate-binding protein n=1 Tax=Azospirillum sp. SYSU D00513 TaxID=2812561 RepID=UPI001A95BEDD|nr:ABC transporter substrate-binding protein [Azospirillum sp. SYSU D00513]
MKALTRARALAGLAGVLLVASFGAGAALAATPAGEAKTIRIGYLAREEPPRIPLTFLEPDIQDEGVQGARLGVADNATTGRFMGQRYELVETVLPRDGDPAEAIRKLAADGVRLVVADLPAEPLLAAASDPAAEKMLIFNARAPDDVLRNESCRANLLHTAPSRRMLADALAQYLVWKRWPEWFLVVGQTPGDKAFADAMERAAKRFGAKIVERRPWTFETGNRRSDTGHTTVQSAIPTATQRVEYDVLVVADEADEFGEYLDHRTWLPRPVAGTQGLVPTIWSRVHEQWGATQLHSRFEKAAGRWMTERDHAAWMAVRSIGEAATRTNATDPDRLIAFIRSGDFGLAAFKGEALTYRPWDGQLRQPILIAGPRMLVSVSPQEGFLHPGSLLDTLGDDRPESRCSLAR